MDLQRKNKIKAEGSMSSMTDLVFLLLIFFIVLSTMASPELEVNYPKSDSEAQPSKTTTIDIAISGENQYFIDAKEDTYTEEEIEAYIEKEMTRFKAEGKSDAYIRLHADAESEVQYLVAMMSYLQVNEHKFVLVTKQK